MWLGTPSGLYRFDGSEFERYELPPGGRSGSDYVYSLRSASDGGLWIGFGLGGAIHLKGGRAVNYGESEGLPLGTLADFAIWAWFISVVAVGTKLAAFLIQYVVFRTIIRRNLERARSAANGAKFRALFDEGDTSEHDGDSESHVRTDDQRHVRPVGGAPSEAGREGRSL